MSAGQKPDLDRDRADVVEASAVHADALVQGQAAGDLLLEALEEALGLGLLVGVLLGEGGQGIGQDLFDRGFGRFFAGRLQGGLEGGADPAFHVGIGRFIVRLGREGPFPDAKLDIMFLLHFDDAADGLGGRGDAAEDELLVHFLAAALDHGHAVLGAHDQEVEGARLHLLDGRIDDVRAADPADLDRADGLDEGDIGEIQGGRGADDAQRVGLVLQVGREEQADDLGLAEIAFREERPDGPVDEAGDQGLPLGGPAFAFEEPAGELARGVGILAVVDDEGQEGLVFTGLLLGGGRDEHDRVAVTDEGGPVRLLGHAAELDGQDAFVDFKTDGVGHGECGFSAYLRSPSFWMSCSYRLTSSFFT